MFSPTPVLPEAPKSDGSDDRDEEPGEQRESGEERKIHKIMMMTDTILYSGAILGHLEPILAHLEAIWNHLGTILSSSKCKCQWLILDAFRRACGGNLKALGSYWEPFGGNCKHRKASWRLIGICWTPLERSKPQSWKSWGQLDQKLGLGGYVGPFGSYLGSICGPVGSHLGVIFGSL